jgi:hypothetical protein
MSATETMNANSTVQQSTELVAGSFVFLLGLGDLFLWMHVLTEVPRRLLGT